MDREPRQYTEGAQVHYFVRTEESEGATAAILSGVIAGAAVDDPATSGHWVPVTAGAETTWVHDSDVVALAG